ncbi:hypothetical protein V6N13_044021 [Hibiscus sabdariffa]
MSPTRAEAICCNLQFFEFIHLEAILHILSKKTRVSSINFFSNGFPLQVEDEKEPLKPGKDESGILIPKAKGRPHKGSFIARQLDLLLAVALHLFQHI